MKNKIKFTPKDIKNLIKIIKKCKQNKKTPYIYADGSAAYTR